MTLPEALQQEHDAILDSLGQVDGALREERLPAARNLWQEIRLHLRAEEAVLYPALRARQETARLIIDSIHDHEAIEHGVDELEKLSFEDGRWVPLFEELEERLRAHLSEEEDTLFKKIHRLFTESEQERLCGELAAFRLRDEAAS